MAPNWLANAGLEFRQRVLAEMRNLDDLPFHLSKPFTESADLKWDTASVLAWLRGLSQAELTVALYSILQHAAQSYEHILFFIQALTERENWLAQIDDLIGIGDIELPNWALQTGENVQERDGALSSHGASIAGEEIESKLAREFLARSDRYQSPLGNLAIARPRKLRKPKVSLLRESTSDVIGLDWSWIGDSIQSNPELGHFLIWSSDCLARFSSGAKRLIQLERSNPIQNGLQSNNITGVGLGQVRRSRKPSD